MSSFDVVNDDRVVGCRRRGHGEFYALGHTDHFEAG